MKFFFFLILASVLVACDQKPAQTDYSDIVITLGRTACFEDACPIYELTVYGDGRVVYKGKRVVSVTGTRTSTLTADQVNELIAAFEQTNYFKLEDEYAANVTDLPSTITSVTLNGRKKTITEYGGCGTYSGDQQVAPQALCDFEAKIDAVTNSAQWVGKQ